MAKKLCPICKQVSVPPVGPKDAEILIVGDAPSDIEINFGNPLTGPSWKVLKDELARVGIDVLQTRRALARIHPDTENEECFNFGISIIVKEAQNRKGILLLGAETSKIFIRKPVTEISGLRVEEEINLFAAPLVVAAPHPGTVMNKDGVVGELRFAFERFASELGITVEE